MVWANKDHISNVVSNTPIGAYYINPKFPRSLLFLFLFFSITYVENINSSSSSPNWKPFHVLSLSSIPSLKFLLPFLIY